jgi:hypothetical protein
MIAARSESKQAECALEVAPGIALRAPLDARWLTIRMTKNELSERLRHLDPGATCHVYEAVLARMFNAEALTGDADRSVRVGAPLQLLLS